MSSKTPSRETITANNPINIKSSSAFPINLVDIKNANEHAIPPNGGMSLVESRFSFSFLLKCIFFEYL